MKENIMKGVAHIALIFCLLVMITKGWNLPLGFDHQTFSTKNLVSVRRVARQVNEVDCSRVRSKALCSPSFAQNYINAVSQCGSVESTQAIQTEELCRQFSAGEYCLSVDINAVITICCGSSVNCSAACRKSLTDFGCCLNPYMDILEQNFTACRLAFPSACPPSSLTIPTSSDNSSCSSREDFISFSKRYFCSNGHPILDEFISNNCPKHACAFVDSCRYRDGKNSLEVINATFNMQVKAITSCLLTSNCSSSCSSTINGLNNLGCCLNIFNASLREISDIFSVYSIITDNTLWQECGITPPEVCASSLSSAAPSTYTTAESSLSVAAPSAYTSAEPSLDVAAPSAYTTAESSLSVAAPSAYTTAESSFSVAAPSAYTTAESSLNVAAPSAYTTVESPLNVEHPFRPSKLTPTPTLN